MVTVARTVPPVYVGEEYPARWCREGGNTLMITLPSGNEIPVPTGAYWRMVPDYKLLLWGKRKDVFVWVYFFPTGAFAQVVGSNTISWAEFFPPDMPPKAVMKRTLGEVRKVMRADGNALQGIVGGAPCYRLDATTTLSGWLNEQGA